MKKILFPMLFLVSMNVSAKTVTCPSEIRCNYEEGACELPKNEGWYLESANALSKFDELTIKISRINAYKIGGHYQLFCTYEYDSKSSIILQMNRSLKLIGDKWFFSGFGNRNAECKNMISVDECVAETIA